MVLPLTLEAFDGSDPEPATVFLPGGRLTQLRNDAREAGYQAGYRDAKEETEATRQEATRELARKLQEITFIHLEARKAVITSLEPLVKQMVDTILPDIASKAFIDILTAQIASVASLLTDGPIRLHCAQDKSDHLEELVASLSDLPLSIRVEPDPDCSEFETRISTPEGARHINLDGAIDGVRQGVTAFLDLAKEESRNG